MHKTNRPSEMAVFCVMIKCRTRTEYDMDIEKVVAEKRKQLAYKTDREVLFAKCMENAQRPEKTLYESDMALEKAFQNYIDQCEEYVCTEAYLAGYKAGLEEAFK